jgi:hypothetical protein
MIGATIRWSNVNGIGVEFDELSLEQQDCLDTLISQLEFRRQYPRFLASVSGKLVKRDRLYAVKFLDISRKGCRISSNIDVSPGERVHLVICWPRDTSPLLILGAVIRWSSREGIGVEFQSLSMRLDHLVSQLQIGNS